MPRGQCYGESSHYLSWEISKTGCQYLDTNAQSTVNKQISYPREVAGLICYRDHMDSVEQLTDLKACKDAGSL